MKTLYFSHSVTSYYSGRNMSVKAPSVGQERALRASAGRRGNGVNKNKAAVAVAVEG